MHDDRNRGRSTSPARPMAPPVYRPQPMPVTVQARMAGGAMTRNSSTAPSVYRPQSPSGILQTMVVPPQTPLAGGPRQLSAPPVYRPAVRSLIQPKVFF